MTHNTHTHAPEMSNMTVHASNKKAMLRGLLLDVSTLWMRRYRDQQSAPSAASTPGWWAVGGGQERRGEERRGGG